LLENGQERFAGCVTFPVYATDGSLVTIYGRNTGDGPKRHVFLPDRSTGLWNAAAAKTYSEIVLVESVIDALSVMMAGHRNVLAIQGTNGFDEADSKTLTTQGVQAVSLLLDGDEAGKKAAERLKEKLQSSFSYRVLTLPDGLDPNAFLQTHGPEKLAAILQTTESQVAPAPRESASICGSNSSALVVTYGMRKYRIMGLEKGPRKLKATIRVEHAGKLHVDTLDFYTSKSRRMLAVDLCRIFEETPLDADLKVIFFGRFESPVFFVFHRSKMDHFLSSWQGQCAVQLCSTRS
ncbi:MAG: toprim domain-containing protein, partial [Kiritimatiellia bacterium]